MDFALTEQQELIRKEVAALSRNFSLDYWLEKDRKHEYPDEFVKAFAEGGWLGLMIPEAYGGAGLGVTEAAIMLHEICASGAGTSGASPIHFYCFPPEPVVRYGTEELKRRELPRIPISTAGAISWPRWPGAKRPTCRPPAAPPPGSSSRARATATPPSPSRA